LHSNPERTANVFFDGLEVARARFAASAASISIDQEVDG